MEYIYHFANASLTLRLIEHLNRTSRFNIEFVTAIHQIDGWAIRVKLTGEPNEQDARDLKAFLDELGFARQPEIRVQMALWSLETGQSPTNVMRRYQVAVVSHGKPSRLEVETFRKQFVMGLGYCPETLA